MKHQVKLFANKIWKGIVAVLKGILAVLLSPFKGIHWLWKWWTAKPTHKITVSYDSKFGNKDDVVYEGVKVISKQTWKELVFLTAEEKVVHIRANAGLNYRVEEE